MSALGVVTDGVAGPHSDPLRNGSVLLQLLGELDLDAEGLVGRLKSKVEIYRLYWNVNKNMFLVSNILQD